MPRALHSLERHRLLRNLCALCRNRTFVRFFGPINWTYNASGASRGPRQGERSERSQAGGGPGTDCTVVRSAVRAQVAVTSRSLTASRRDTHVPTASRRNSDRVSLAPHLALSRASWASSRRDTSHGIQTSSRSASIAGCCRRRAPGMAARIRTRQTSMPVCAARVIASPPPRWDVTVL